MEVGKQPITEAKGHAYGNISVKDAFAKSSNVAVSKLLVKDSNRGLKNSFSM